MLGQFVGRNHPLLNRNNAFCFRHFGGIWGGSRDHLLVCPSVGQSYADRPAAIGSRESHACCSGAGERRLTLASHIFSQIITIAVPDFAPVAADLAAAKFPAAVVVAAPAAGVSAVSATPVITGPEFAYSEVGR